MQIQSLCGPWQFRQAGATEWLPAHVPGGVHTDLMALGGIPDPFVGDNEQAVQWVAETDWEYRTRFSCAADVLAQERVWLVCDGLDTLATVTLDGQLLGQTDNMFRRYRWEVGDLLRQSDGGMGAANRQHDLQIAFGSPVQFVRRRQAGRPLAGVSQAIAGGPYLRKAPCQFGWDWGPQLPPVGVWKDIRLEGCTSAQIEDVHLRQQHAHGEVVVSARVRVDAWGDAPLQVVLRLTDPKGVCLESAALVAGGEAAASVTVQQPQLWWPNGCGDQPLYEAEVILMRGDRVMEARRYRLGLRTIELRQEPDAWGRSFEFVVNGRRIFIKGSNWIPADSFPTRISDERLEELIRAAAETHQNMLRVWGGGFYESERFYDLCDHYGILVWQDFIFSCSIYPLDDPAFVENVRMEAVENMRRLRHRAALALWCGNNEMEQGWVDWQWNTPEQQALKYAYHLFFHRTLPAWVAEIDPDRPYWPSSPSSDVPFEDPNGQLRGDAHYWDVWHGRKPFTAYRQQYPRFMSEFGFQALPPLDTIRAYAAPEDWNMTSYIMERHQKNASGNGLMITQMTDAFRMAKDFPSLVYLSMALQAEGIRYGVEHWRRNMQRVAGIIYWQLNDCWPVASWSSLDYFGRWKALHYAARRFFAPLLLSIEDQPPEMAIHVTSDLDQPWQGEAVWSLETLDGEVLEAGAVPVQAPPHASMAAGAFDFSAHSDRRGRELVFTVELRQGESCPARQVAFFAPSKHLALRDPAIAAQTRVAAGGVQIDLQAHSLARLVEVALEGAEVIFSDNYFDLPAGRQFTVTCPLPEGWDERQARQSLRVRSLFDSFDH